MSDPYREGSHLAQWFREIERGQRTVTQYDTLYRAAAWEAWAWEHAPGSYPWKQGIEKAQNLMLIAEGKKVA